MGTEDERDRADLSSWDDLNERLANSGLPPSTVAGLVDALTQRLVGHFGATAVEVALGKHGLRRHEMREVATAALAHLSDALALAAPDQLDALVNENGSLHEAVPMPWDNDWGDDQRTASWRF